jgi:hypothetical protein
MEIANSLSSDHKLNKQHNFTSSPHPPLQQQPRTAPADSGASGIFLASRDEDLITPSNQPHNTTFVQAAEGSIIKSKAAGTLQFKGLPGVAFPAKVFDDLQGSLLGVGTIIDGANVKAVLSSDSIKFVNQQGVTVLAGPRCKDTGLWNINLDESVTHNPQLLTERALAVRPLPMDSVGDLIEWWHGSLGFPVASTFLRAISGWLRDKIPGVTLESARRNKDRLKSITSAKGHLNQSRQGARSTSERVPRRRTNKDNIIVHMPTQAERNDMDIAHLLVDKYLMFFYSSGGNYIHIELLDSKGETQVLNAYKQGIAFFTARGLKPNVQRMDNEPSFLTAAFQAFQGDNDISIDRVPPGQHRRNKAERAIETGKHHIIAALAGADPAFPMKGVKHLMPQIELTLNLLRQSRKSPSTSAWEQLNGAYDFNAWPLGPMGCRVLCHEKPDDRSTWGVHGKEGFYVGPTTDHYRCYDVFIPSTSRVRTTDTLSWHPDLLSTKSSCSLTRLNGALAVLNKAVTSLSKNDITTTNRDGFATANNTLASIQTQLNVKLTQAAAEQRVSPMTAPATVPPVDPAAPATCHQLPPAVTNVTAPVPEQGVAVAPVRVNEPAHSEQGVAAGPTVPMARRRGNQQHTDSLFALSACQPVYKSPALRKTNAAVQRNIKQSREARLPYEERRALMRAERNAGKRRPRKPRQKQPEFDVWDEPSCPTPQHQRQLKRLRYKARQLLLSSLHYANTAVDLDEDGRKLLYHNAVRGPNGELWELAGGEEIIRLFDSKTGRLIRLRDIPRDVLQPAVPHQDEKRRTTVPRAWNGWR